MRILSYLPIIIFLLLLSCRSTLVNRQEPDSSLSDILEPYYDFYFYRKYRDEVPTCEFLVSPLYRRENEVGLISADLKKQFYIHNYHYPTLMDSKFYRINNGIVTKQVGVAYFEEMVNLNGKVGDTLKSDVSAGWVHQEITTYAGLPMYIMKRSYIDLEISYIHNIGFISETWSYEDSIISWRLESVNGIQLDTFLRTAPDYGFKFLEE